MVRDREKLNSVLDSAPRKSMHLAKMFKKKVSTTIKMQACVTDRRNDHLGYTEIHSELLQQNTMTGCRSLYGNNSKLKQENCHHKFKPRTKLYALKF
jgi:hypothetical protein